MPLFLRYYWIDLARVDSLKIIEVTFFKNLCASEHIGNTFKSCSQSLYALRLLRAHVMCDSAIQTIFRSVVIAKLTYAASACRGFTRLRSPTYIDAAFFASPNAADNTLYIIPLFDELCDTADEQLFDNVYG